MKPPRKRRNTEDTLPGAPSGISPSPPSEGDKKRSRTAKACDRCKVKKVKCSGQTPCTRCQIDDAICCFESPGRMDDKPVSAALAHQMRLERDLLVQTLRLMYQNYNPGCTHVAGRGPQDQPSLQDIIESTGIVLGPSDPFFHQDTDAPGEASESAWPDGVGCSDQDEAFRHKVTSNLELTSSTLLEDVTPVDEYHVGPVCIQPQSFIPLFESSPSQTLLSSVSETNLPWPTLLASRHGKHGKDYTEKASHLLQSRLFRSLRNIPQPRLDADLDLLPAFEHENEMTLFDMPE